MYLPELEMSRSECQISSVPAGVTDDLSCLTLQPSHTLPSLMQEVESRKRPHIGDSDPLPSKKRAVSVNSTTILVNGDVHSTPPVDEEPRDQDSLEVSKQAQSISLALVPCFVFLMYFVLSSKAIPQGGHFPPHETLLARK